MVYARSARSGRTAPSSCRMIDCRTRLSYGQSTTPQTLGKPPDRPACPTESRPSSLISTIPPQPWPGSGGSSSLCCSISGAGALAEAGFPRAIQCQNCSLISATCPDSLIPGLLRFIARPCRHQHPGSILCQTCHDCRTGVQTHGGMLGGGAISWPKVQQYDRDIAGVPSGREGATPTGWWRDSRREVTSRKAECLCM